MPVKIKTPSPTLPPGYRPPRGLPYKVQPGDHWGSVADKHNVPVMDLIRFNFGTIKSDEVNYYLKHNVGCTEVSPDGKNYSFRNASPGIIYVPIDFAYATEPLDRNLVSMTVFPHSEFTIRDHLPEPTKKIWCKTYFEVHIGFDSSIVDVMPYEYRQYIRGRVRARTSSTNWFDMKHQATGDKGIEVPVPGNNAASKPIDQFTFLEDGSFDLSGNVLRYGYRAAAPFMTNEFDFYYRPFAKTPPQTGYRYRSTDFPGVIIPKTFTNSSGNPESVKGLSIELDFRGDVIESRNGLPYAVIRSETWSFAGHFNITSRNPLMVEKINSPP